MKTIGEVRTGAFFEKGKGWVCDILDSKNGEIIKTVKAKSEEIAKAKGGR